MARYGPSARSWPANRDNHTIIDVFIWGLVPVNCNYLLRLSFLHVLLPRQLINQKIYGLARIFSSRVSSWRTSLRVKPRRKRFWTVAAAARSFG